MGNLDMYKLIKEGKSFEDIAEMIQNEYTAAEKKVEEERIAAEAEQKKQELYKNARETAIAAMTEYFALVNPTINKEICELALDTLGNIKITVSSKTDGKSRKKTLIESWLDEIFNW